jgi:hypothetical protein
MRLIYTLLLFIFFYSANSQSDKRTDLTSLNGIWEIIYDEKNEGKIKGFHTNDGFTKGKIEKINVPSVWERYKKDYEGVVYYRTKFKVDKRNKNNKIHLNFKASNYITEIFLNDNSVGFHEGGFTPFSFNIEHIVDFENDNILIVKVLGPITIQEKIIDGIGQMETPQWRGSYTGGIWQDVFLSYTGQTHFNDVFIKANYKNGEIEIENEIINGLGDGMYKISVFINNNLQDEKTFELKNSNLRIKEVINTKINSHKLWSPDYPNVYDLNLKLFKLSTHSKDTLNQILDNYNEKFGFREFTVKNNKFYLNDNPIYLKAAFFEGLYPVKLSFPDSKEMMIKEILMAKEAGFNMIRPWRKPPPKEWLHLADSIGVLTVGSMAIECMDMPIESAYLPKRVENEITESILRDRNHPSIVQWELFNEIRRPVLANMLKPMSLKARELDPTRLILDESGGWAAGANLYLPFSNNAFKFNDIHNYPGPNITNNKFDGFLTIGNTAAENKRRNLNARTPGRNVVPNIPSYVSEIGYGSLPNLEENEKDFKEKGNPITYPYLYHLNYNRDIKEKLYETGLIKIFKNASNFYKKQQEIHGYANKRMIEAIRSNSNVIGYCVHALTAGDWIIGAGLLDIWRNPKGLAFDKTKEANKSKIAVLRTNKRNYFKGENILISPILINDKNPEINKVKINVYKKREIIFNYEKIIDIKNGITNLEKINLGNDLEDGEYEVKISLINNKKTDYETSINFNIFSVLNLNKNKSIAILKEDKKLIQFLKKYNIKYELFNDFTTTESTVIISDINTKVLSSKDGNVIEQNNTNASNTFKDQIDLVNDFVFKGGNAIFLQVPGKTRKRIGPNLTFVADGTDYLPHKPIKNISQGLWDGILHINSKHKFFKGLPINVNMSGLYENIAPTISLRNFKGQNIVQTIAFDRIPNGNIMKRNYIGSGEVWSGSDLSIVNHGDGKIVLSTLKLLENLNFDPVSEIMLLNMINFFD